jgi:hypothetical protein
MIWPVPCYRYVYVHPINYNSVCPAVMYVFSYKYMCVCIYKDWASALMQVCVMWNVILLYHLRRMSEMAKIYAFMHTCMHAYIQLTGIILRHILEDVNVKVDIHTCTYIHTYIHTADRYYLTTHIGEMWMRKEIFTYIHTYIHTYTHTFLW